MSLADLTNSSFITYSENLMYLNDAYTKLYQKMIDAGDKYFMKSYVINGASSSASMESYYDLPSDFYQLYSVQITPTCVPILRKSKNEPQSSQRYDIINGQLVLYGNISDNVRVEYYPVPATITYPAPEIDLPAGTYLDACGSKYVSLETSTGSTVVNIYDASTDESYTLVTLPAAYTGAIIGTYGIVAYNTSGALLVAMDGTYQSPATGTSIIPVKIDDDVGTCSVTSSVATVLQMASSGYSQKVISAPVAVSTTLPATFDYSTGSIYYSTGSAIYKDGAIIKQVSGNTVLNFINGRLYYNSNGMMFSYGDGTTAAVCPPSIGQIICLNKYDLNTGYGITVKRGTSYYIDTIAADYKLDYPVTSLYSLMSYYLAIAYCVKQNKDYSGLAAKAAEQEVQYADMMNMDSNLNYRISNVYAAASI